MTYHVGQIVNVEIKTPLGARRLRGRITNTLPAEMCEHPYLVVVDHHFEDQQGRLVRQEGTQYVGWFNAEELDGWQRKDAAA